MENALYKLGSSLSVPFVQDLAASLDSSNKIPERYMRHDVANEPIVVDTEDIELPVIDLELAKISKEEALKLGRACEEWGFFQLINHGVPSELVEKMKLDSMEFFSLPTEEKMVVAQHPNFGFEGYGHFFVKSEEQKLDWQDILALTTLPIDGRNKRFWPTNPSTFRDTLDAYTSATKEVTICLLKLMAENLGVDPQSLLDSLKDMSQVVSLNYYPPCPESEKVIGISPHSDAFNLTILCQADDVIGLQIRKNGTWFPVKPLPGAFIVNIGDAMEIFSNGKYKSIEHRAVVNSEKARLSIAAFHGPNPSSMIGPSPQLVKGVTPKYKSFCWEEYMKAYFGARLDGKSQLEKMKLKS